MKSIAVFCGSSEGLDIIYKIQAHLLGQALAEQEIILVYGGAKYGLMGAVADGVLTHGGKVIGVLPHFLMNKEVAHQQLTELILVDSMHERKQEMFELCDGFIIIPGGLGTMEELFEIWTWAQLGLHQKPIAILNMNGFYDPLIELIRSMVQSGFVKEESRNLVLVDDTIEGVLQKMKSHNSLELDPRLTTENM